MELLQRLLQAGQRPVMDHPHAHDLTPHVHYCVNANCYGMPVGPDELGGLVTVIRASRLAFDKAHLALDVMHDPLALG